MLAPDEKWPPTLRAERVAWENEQRKIQNEKELELRKIEALERIAEALESIRSAQWID